MSLHELSPIVAIRNKELDLAERLAAARRTAEAERESVRSLVAELRAEAESQTRDEIESVQRAALAAADEEAAQIIATGDRVAAEISANGRRQMAAIVEHIVAFVLPTHAPTCFATMPAKGVTEYSALQWLAQQPADAASVQGR